jgi:hypothetical protein
MRIVVTGDADEEIVYAALDILHAITPVTMVIECGGPHAELWARFWAEDNDVKVRTIREHTPVSTASKAFSYNPVYVLAFPWPSMAIIDKATRKGVQVGYASITSPQALDGTRVQDGAGQHAPVEPGSGEDPEALHWIDPAREVAPEFSDHYGSLSGGEDPELAHHALDT